MIAFGSWPWSSGAVKLPLAVAVLAVIWLGVLPRLTDQPHVAEHIRRQQELGIDPSAMFYSELEILPPIAHRVERLELQTLAPRPAITPEMK